MDYKTIKMIYSSLNIPNLDEYTLNDFERILIMYDYLVDKNINIPINILIYMLRNRYTTLMNEKYFLNNFDKVINDSNNYVYNNDFYNYYTKLIEHKIIHGLAELKVNKNIIINGIVKFIKNSFVKYDIVYLPLEQEVNNHVYEQLLSYDNKYLLIEIDLFNIDFYIKQILENVGSFKILLTIKNTVSTINYSILNDIFTYVINNMSKVSINNILIVKYTEDYYNNNYYFSYLIDRILSSNNILAIINLFKKKFEKTLPKDHITYFNINYFKSDVLINITKYKSIFVNLSDLFFSIPNNVMKPLYPQMSVIGIQSIGFKPISETQMNEFYLNKNIQYNITKSNLNIYLYKLSQSYINELQKNIGQTFIFTFDKIYTLKFLNNNNEPDYVQYCILKDINNELDFIKQPIVCYIGTSNNKKLPIDDPFNNILKNPFIDPFTNAIKKVIVLDKQISLTTQLVYFSNINY